MSIDQNLFLLENALENAWENLCQDDKATLSGCLPKTNNSDNQIRSPKNENELDALHSISTACEFLNSFELKSSKGYLYLNEKGKALPYISRKFIYKVAQILFSHNISLKKSAPDFEQSLIDFIKSTNSHVATLNYDKLLYTSFVANNLCTGFDGNLVDGFTKEKGFSPENLQRFRGKNFGYYLHLHGSPLFITAESQNKIIKIKPEEVAKPSSNYSKHSKNHIVLSNINHKPQIIASSPLLSSYWETLSFCMSESCEVILFGYSGYDTHLNKVIRQFFSEKQIKIVEWVGAEGNREEFWRQKLENTSFVLCPLKNITEFNSW